MMNKIKFMEKLQKDFAQMCKAQEAEIKQQQNELRKTFKEIKLLMSKPIGAH